MPAANDLTAASRMIPLLEPEDMQPMIKNIENTESANAFRFVNSNALGNTIVAETSYGISKRQLIVAMLLADSANGIHATQGMIDYAYQVADLILAGPSGEKDMVDLDRLGSEDH